MQVHQVQEEMRNGQVPLEEYVITKSLTKPPEAYPDAKNQPHVEVSPWNYCDLILEPSSKSTVYLDRLIWIIF